MVVGVVRGIIGFIVSALLGGLCLVFGFAPDEWIAGLIKTPPEWLLHPLTRVLAFLLGGLFGFVAWRLLIAWRRERRDSKKRDAVAEPATSSDPVYIALNEAATRAYEQSQGTPAARMAEITAQEGAGILTWYAYAIVGREEDGIPLFGKRPPARVRRQIPPGEIGFHHFSEDASSLALHGEDAPRYIDLEVLESDFSERFREIQSWGTDKEDPVESVRRLYARGVQVRNHAASLRVLDRRTHTEMDEIGEELKENMRKLAPVQSINLDTLNTYDKSDHPTLRYLNSDRAYIFSELLLRTQRILERHPG